MGSIESRSSFSVTGNLLASNSRYRYLPFSDGAGSEVPGVFVGIA